MPSIYRLSLAACVYQDRIISTEMVWPAKPRILPSSSLQKKSADQQMNTNRTTPPAEKGPCVLCSSEAV